MTAAARRRVVENLGPDIIRAEADILQSIAGLTPKYSRTVLAIGMLMAVDSITNSADPIRRPARDAIADEACQLWARLGSRR